MAKVIQARVLTDMVALGLMAGCIVEASPSAIGEMAKAGSVDPHKDAVAYAKSQGAKVVPLVTQEDIAQREALQADVNLLTAKLAAAAEKDKPAIQKDLDTKTAALADLA